MADHRAENIIAAVIATLTGLTTTGANCFRGRVYELPDSELPALCVYLGTDNPRSDGGSSSWMFIDSDLTINVEAVVKDSAAQVDTTLNQIRYEVGQALQADYTQGLAYVINTTEGLASPELSGEGEKITGRMRMEYTFLYRRERYTTPPAPPVSCAYPLDGDITGSGFQPMTISGAGQQTATVAIAGSGTNANYLAVPSGAFPGPFATLDLSTGIRVVGFVPTVPAAVDQSGNKTAYRAEYTLATAAFSTVLSVNITATTGGLFDIVVYVGATTAKTFTGLASVPSFIAMIFNANTSTVAVQFDGTPVSLTADSYTPDALVASVVVVETTDSASGDAGKVVGGTIATYAADIPGTYPSGATDPCGNAL